MAAPNDLLLYTVTVKNTGVVDTVASVTDTLPAQVTFVSGGEGVSHNAGVVTWSGPVTAGVSVPITYQVRINAPLPAGTQIVNTAQVADACGRSWTTNAVTTTLRAANVTVSKEANTAEAASDTVVTYTIVIQNVGQVEANVVMTDVMPTGLTVEDAWVMSGPGSVVWASDAVTYTGTLDTAYNNTARIRFRATISGSFPNVVRNVAWVNDGQGNVVSDDAVVAIAPVSRIYLPLVMRNYKP